jgi:hypothetical protein
MRRPIYTCIITAGARHNDREGHAAGIAGVALIAAARRRLEERLLREELGAQAHGS